MVPVYDSVGREIAHFVFFSSTHSFSAFENMTVVHFHIWHTALTHLDAITISFETTGPNNHFQVYYETPTNGPPMIIAEAQVDHYVFQFPELGVHGESTTNFRYLVRKYTDHPSVRVIVQIAFHNTQFPILTQYYAQGAIEIS
jgi:hypothetical protein